jgi:recombination associated protein RdgC
MWFKNIQLYQFKQPISYQPDLLEKQLQHSRFTPCSALAPITAGFTAPFEQSEDSPLVFAQQGFMLLCIKIQEKLLPPSVLREQHQNKIKEMEAKLGTRVSKGERQRIKEELEYTLLGQAFDRSSLVYLYVNTHTQQLIIDTSSTRKLQLVHKLIQPIFADYELTPPTIKTASSVLTEWIKEKNYPGTFSVLNRCTLQDIKTPKAKISLTHINVFDDYVGPLIEDNSQVTQLKLNWDEKINFTIKHDFTISQVKFLDEIKSLAKDGLPETAADRFAADFFVMAETLSQFLADLLPPFIDHEAVREEEAEAVAA